MNLKQESGGSSLFKAELPGNIWALYPLRDIKAHRLYFSATEVSGCIVSQLRRVAGGRDIISIFAVSSPFVLKWEESGRSLAL